MIYKKSKDNNPYLGKRFYEIDAALVRQHGESSAIVHDIREVVELCHKLLYDNLEPAEDNRVTNRLRELTQQVGPAARAIIQDFDRDAHDNEGWEPVNFDEEPPVLKPV